MADERDIDRDIRGGSRARPDRRLAALAGRQHGVVARRQLPALGLSEDAVDRRVQAGRLIVVHRGVYAVGHRALTQRSRWMAAVLAAGPGAVLSHRSAAALWGIRNGSAVEVTAPHERRRPNIRTYRGTLAPDEVTARDGIPVTTVARTLLDLAAVLKPHDVEATLHEAEYRQLSDLVPLGALVARHQGRRGTATVKRLLEELQLGVNITKEQLERDFLAFLDAHDLPRPRRNHVVEGFTCDCVWPERRLIVELDGSVHRTRKLFESDRRRDRKLTLANWRPIRVTSRMLAGQELRLDLQRLLR